MKGAIEYAFIATAVIILIVLLLISQLSNMQFTSRELYKQMCSNIFFRMFFSLFIAITGGCAAVPGPTG